MSVKAVCTGCGKTFNAPDQFAGKKVKCKVCGAAFRVPGPAAAAEAPRAAATRPATSAAARTAPKAAATTTARQTKPVAAPVPADDDQGEYGLSDGGDDWSALEAAAPAPSYNPSGAPAAAPAYKPSAAVAGASRGTVFPSTAQPMSARKNAVAAGQGMHPLMKAQLGAAGLCVLLLGLAMIVPAMALPAIMVSTLVAMAFMLWGQIGILMAAGQEGAVCILLYLFLPFYPLYFILTRFEEVSHHVIRTIAGVALMFGAVMVILSQQP